MPSKCEAPERTTTTSMTFAHQAKPQKGRKRTWHMRPLAASLTSTVSPCEETSAMRVSRAKICAWHPHRLSGRHWRTQSALAVLDRARSTEIEQADLALIACTDLRPSFKARQKMSPRMLSSARSHRAKPGENHQSKKAAATPAMLRIATKLRRIGRRGAQEIRGGPRARLITCRASSMRRLPNSAGSVHG